MQNWSSLLEQGVLDQLGGTADCDSLCTHDHILSCGNTADVIDTPPFNDREMSSKKKKQLRCIFLMSTAPTLVGH